MGSSSSPSAPPPTFSDSNELECPSMEDYHGTSELQMDQIEGCRIVFSRLWSPSGLAISHTLNLGTYSSLGNDQNIMKALLNPQSVPQGDKNWATTIRKNSGRSQTIARYSSNNNQCFLRSAYAITPKWNGHVGVYTHANSIYRHLSNLFPSDGLRARPNGPSPDDDDVVTARLERVTEKHNCALKLTFQGGAGGRPATPPPPPSHTGGFPKPTHKQAPSSGRSFSATGDAVRSLAGSVASAALVGCEYSAVLIPEKLACGSNLTLSPKGVILTSTSARFQPRTDLVGAVTVSTSPNFELPMEAGLLETVYRVKSTWSYRYLPNLNILAGVEAPCIHDTHTPFSVFNSLRGAVGLVGYEYSLVKSRMSATINTNGVLQACVQTLEGFTYFGLIDYAVGTYKFGFGYEVTKVD